MSIFEWKVMHEAHIKHEIIQQIQTAIAEVDYNISLSYPHPQKGGFDGWKLHKHNAARI